MPLELVALGITVAGSGLTGAAVWGAARTRLNRVEADMRAVEADLVKHKETDTMQHTDMVQRLARIETIVQRIDQKL